MFLSQIQPTSAASMKQPRSITLSAGQLFQGSITKIFPNNIAALSANGMQLTARLEAALTVGQQYWFEVKDATGLPHLRVLDDNNMRREGATAVSERVLQQLGLPPSKAMESLVSQLTALKIPFSKESLLSGFQVLTDVNQLNEKGFQSIANLLQRNLPITKDSLLSYQTLMNQQSLTNQLNQLDNSLVTINTGVAKDVKELIGKMLKPGSFHQPTNSPIALLLSLTIDEEPGAMQLLVRLGIVKEGTSTQQLHELIRQAVTNQSNQQVVERLWPGLSDKNTLNVSSLISKLEIPASKEGFLQLGQLLTLLKTQESVEEVQRKWVMLPTSSIEKEERAVLQRILESTTAMANEKTAGSHLKSMLMLLGLQHEHDVTRFLQGDGGRESIYSERLKALLLSLQQQDLPPAIKDQVNQMLLRITGQQLLYQEQNGPFQHLLVQLPIALGSYQTDLTMQWEGKKNEQGELDPNFCRVLFYLTLERLQETIIDLQIQNRVVAVTVYNEKDKPQALIDLLAPSLKQALAKQNYQLSAISWKNISEQQQENKPMSVYQQRSSYQGVDLRI